MTHPTYGRIDGAIVMIGFGSIGKGTWPLIERHFDYDADRFIVIEPDADNHRFLRQHNLAFDDTELTPENYRDVLGRLLTPGAGFCVNLSVDTSSLDIMKFCREIDVPYIDTVVEPWAGYYFDTVDNAARTNYALCQAVRDEKDAQHIDYSADVPRREMAWTCNPAIARSAFRRAVASASQGPATSAGRPRPRPTGKAGPG